jgi:hypothetical protein
VTFLPISADHAGKTLIFRPVSRGTAIANNRTYSVVYAPQFTTAAPIDFIYTEAGDPLTADNGSYYEVETT